MNSRYQTDDDLQDLRDSREQDREISLGTTTILGIFFALALLCAVFFGFGYSLGRRSAPPVAGTAEPATTSSESSAAKPAPGSQVARATSALPAIQADDASRSSITSDAPATTTSAEVNQPTLALTRVKAVAADFRPEPSIKPTAKSTPAAFLASAAPGVAIVQVAAVSHQEDADVLVNALKHRGYNVAIHHEPQDKLLHVQIGPFPTKKDADAMRQRLQTDGYNAIVK